MTRLEHERAGEPEPSLSSAARHLSGQVEREGIRHRNTQIGEMRQMPACGAPLIVLQKHFAAASFL